MKKILGILTITLVLAACDKEQKLTENLELTKNSNEFIINDSTIEKIGEYHNESLSKAFKNLIGIATTTEKNYSTNLK